MLRVLFLLSLILLALWASPGLAHAETITGVPRVIDGDTVEVSGVRVRLYGIDAPESDQVCWSLSDPPQPWACGPWATTQLRQRIGAAPITCHRMDTDPYGRMIGLCLDEGGADLNGWMVEIGAAVAYRRFSRRYVGLEAQARTTQAGIWSGRFHMPWEWRRMGR